MPGNRIAGLCGGSVFSVLGTSVVFPTAAAPFPARHCAQAPDSPQLHQPSSSGFLIVAILMGVGGVSWLGLEFP